MDSIYISDSSRVIDGLTDMMEVADGMGSMIYSHCDVATVLLIVEVAKLAADRVDWFPHGKWATIQMLQGKVFSELSKLQAALQEEQP